MNKKFKLTDKVTKESIRSPEFKRWLMRTLAVVFIISLIFQFSTCVYQGINAYAVETYSTNDILGTWFYNGGVVSSTLPATNQYFFLEGTFSYVRNNTNITLYDLSAIRISSPGTPTVLTFYNGLRSTTGSYSYMTQFYSSNDRAYCYPYSGGGSSGLVSDYPELATFTITSIDETVDYSLLYSFLNSYCTKLSGINVYDFTNEIRVFNDELTYFITDQASWVDVFYFDYEILGFGKCDYMTLQRTTSNEYLMRYNVVSDGADGYLHTSYRYYVSQSRGGFLRENYKTIRFISNPENTDLQQWLLDNTTLIGTVDDQETYEYIYDMGFNVGYNSGYEQGFANSLIGDSLSGPINALSSITLIQIGDTVITLGGVIMTAIALCLVLAFLKLYAGG